MNLEIGDVAAMPLRDGGFGACVVLASPGDYFIVGALAWRSEGPPSLAELAATHMLTIDHHAHRGEPAVISIDRDTAPPADWRWLGTLAGIEPVGECLSFSGWHYLPSQVDAQRRWDAFLPDSFKSAYKAAAAHPATRVEIDFGGGPHEFPVGTGNLDFSRFALLAHEGTPDWAQLDALPMLQGLSWEGTDRGLVAALARRPGITALRWENPPPIVDISATAVESLWISGSRPRRLVLPDRLERLTFFDDSGELPEVVAAADGARIGLFIVSPEPAIPSGLGSVRDLQLSVGGTFTAASLAALPDLEELRIDWTAPPGELTDAAELAALPSLRSLDLNCAYALDAEALPATWTALRSLSVDGVRRSTAKLLKSRYRGSGLDLSVRGAKTDEWLAANLNNPFRDWIGEDRRAATAACKAYATALHTIGQANEAAPAQAEAALQTFVEALNQVDERHDGFVDTIRREESYDAFHALAQKAGIDQTQADQWFDTWRAF